MFSVSFRKGEHFKLNIVAPKSIFKRAVDRNLIKRWVREAMREYAREKKDTLPMGVYTIKAKNKDLLNQHYRDIKRLLHNSL